MGPVRVVVTGGTGVIGRAAVSSLLGAGNRVEVVCRSERNRAQVLDLGARAVDGDLFDADTLVPLFRGADAVVNLATRIPVGYAAAWSRAWRENDRLRTVGAGNVVAAARLAGVRRVVQEGVSLVYADAGDEVIDEDSPLDITPATEPMAVAESAAGEFTGGPRTGVVLRFGMVVGEDPQTRFQLRAAANGRPVGIGRPDQWAHLVHTDDLGPAVVAALQAPAGIYNVGAAPVRRGDLVAGYAEAAGVEEVGFLGPVLRRLAGPRAEPLARSLRVSSQRFTSATGWEPSRPLFDPAWLRSASAELESLGVRIG